jgi:hypothetical protein
MSLEKRKNSILVLGKALARGRAGFFINIFNLFLLFSKTPKHLNNI